MESLALKYRPRTFEDLVGQKAVQVILRQMVAKDAVHPALLFDGGRGTGKTTTARILAAALNCESTARPCGHCPSCKAVYDGTSLNVIEIDAASNGLVDNIRDLRSHVMYGVGGMYRVVILDEAHSMSTAAFNALLKTLEEPPPCTVFVLLTTEPGKILNTVASRCMPFNFRRIGIADTINRLDFIAKSEHLDVQPELLAVIAERSDGGLRDAVMLLDQVTRIGITTVDAFVDLMGETDFGPTLLRAITSADHATVFTVLDEHLIRSGDAAAIGAALTATLRDLLILRSGGQLNRQGAALQIRTELAGALDSVSIVKALTILWDLRKVRAGDDPRTALDLAVVMVGEVFAKTVAPPTATPAPDRKLTFAEMAALR